ncbi:flagellar protein FlgN [Bacillus niameyensis]|uniref:flagellar protein FlgN n=1 Tax=Bacillus niameyensis TaxID=1522308 RepID=UPI0007830341|nr:flagellar protein FlgN [Bacillus niameyensis]
MTSQTLIESMEKLYTLHEQLHKVALEKTAALKQNDIQALGKLLREEQKLVAEIQIANRSREQAVELLTGEKGMTMSDLISKMVEPEREKLNDLQMQLSTLLQELQNANDLNQQLLQYSLQFVNMNLDMLAPEPELPNYTKTREEASEYPGTDRPVFDSKA